MPKMFNLIGQKFNKLTVLKKVESKNGDVHWLCRCDCGNEKITTTTYLRNGDVKSCGCLKKEHSGIVLKQNNHGHSQDRLYGIWGCMIQRCTNPNNNSYKRYGARGITVCDEWFDFTVFRKWSMDNGYNPNAKRGECTLDRIDNNGNYCPENCQWVSMKEQAINKRNNRKITINGETHCLTDWAKIYNIKRRTIQSRLQRGWNEVQAIITPVKKYDII